jgi:hypothetical protein
MQKVRRGSCHLAAGCHPRYMLPRYLLAYHTSRSPRNLEILHIRGGSGVCCGYDTCGCRRLLQLELVNLSLGVCDRTPLKKQGFISQDPIGGFLTK